MPQTSLSQGNAAVSATNRLPTASADAGPSWTPAQLLTTSADMQTAVDVTAAPTTGLKIVADDLLVSADTDLTLTLEEETTGTDLAVLYLAARVPVQLTLRSGLRVPTAGKKLRAKTSAAGNVALLVSYHSE